MPHIDSLYDMAHILPMVDLARNAAQIGSHIRRARKRHRWSQTELGQRSGLRQETISLIENGNPASRVDTILAVLAALDLEFRVEPRLKGAVRSMGDLF